MDEAIKNRMKRMKGKAICWVDFVSDLSARIGQSKKNKRTLFKLIAILSLISSLGIEW